MRASHHCVYSIKCYLVLVTKYRNRCFTDEVLLRLESIFTEQCAKWGVELLEFSGESDHVHLMLDLHPSVAPLEVLKEYINNQDRPT
nr:IS200/IS605 family transposase [Psychromonas marina]